MLVLNLHYSHLILYSDENTASLKPTLHNQLLDGGFMVSGLPQRTSCSHMAVTESGS